MKVFDNYFINNNVNMVIKRFNNVRRQKLKKFYSIERKKSGNRKSQQQYSKTPRKITNIKNIFFKKEISLSGNQFG